MEPDFSGYATKAGLKCTDGRTIMPEAFQHQDKTTVPLVWQHGHNDVNNVLGHARLEAREDGVYAYGYFNDTTAGQNAKAMVEHGDVVSLSIYANQLVEKAKQVFHGAIREVSLVLSGANPGAKIDFVSIRHSDGSLDELDDEAVIFSGTSLEHAESDDDSDDVEDGETVADIIDDMTDRQRNALYYAVGAALEAAKEEIKQSDMDETEDNLEHKEEGKIKVNVFEQNGLGQNAGPSLSHDQIKTIMEDAQKLGSLKESVLKHAVDYGIENIDLLFPDAKTITNAPEWIKRRTEWVAGVISGTHHTPFSRIKTLSADITHEDARARGYIKGNLKKEEWFGLSQRITTPTTIYKKQKLDRDDIIDITDLDIVSWLKGEMRLMLDEELARAILVGDGRPVEVGGEPNPDKINENHIRPIAKDDDFYAHKVTIPANTTGDNLIESILRARPFYRGSGNLTMYTTESALTDLLLIKDKMGRRLYPTQGELESALRVSKIFVSDVLEGQTTPEGNLYAILTDLSDYNVGADRGGQVAMFDDFDIDYNQHKYLIETRCSGALTRFKSALVISKATGTQVIPPAPTFNAATNIITLPATTGVVWEVDGAVETGTFEVTALNTPVTVEAVPAEDYYFPNNITTEWTFTYQA